MGLYRDLYNALERNGFFESLVNDEFRQGMFIIPCDNSAATAKMNYWADILDDELGKDWWAEIDMYLGKNPDPNSWIYTDAVIIEMI